MSRLLYLYGFVAPDGPPPPLDLAGVGDTAVRRIALGGVGAVVGDVPEADFSPDAVEARMRDLAWIGDQGALHERVVTWFVDHGGILPARLLTLYSSEPSLAQAIKDGSERIKAELARLRGLREWDLKISYRAEDLRKGLAAVSDKVAELDRAIAGADPGRRYLLERKREKLLDAETVEAARRLGDEAIEGFGALARQVRRIATPQDRVDLPVVVHAALLIAADREPALEQRADAETRRLAPLGLTIALSGPWAPYRFLTAEQDDE